MFADLSLAVLHHLLVFPLFAVFVAEAAIIRAGMNGAALDRLGRLDMMYGILSLLVIAVGAARVVFGLRGWDYYAGNHAFWGKMTAFAIVGIVSLWPSRAFVGWRKAAAADPSYSVPQAEITRVRHFIHIEALFFALIVIFAAMMARGVGA